MKKVTISIIVLCYNEKNNIDRCLKSIFDFSPVEGGYEIIVVDGLSQDGTRDILAGWQRKEKRLKIVDNPGRITPVAMNLGIRAARGEFVIFLSAHVEYPQDLLVECLPAFQNANVDNVGGILVTLPSASSLEARLVQAITTHRFGVGNAEFRVGAKEGYTDTVAYGCYRRNVFDRIGLHDERLVRNQDYEINRRLIQSGGHIWQNPKIKSYYYNQATVRGLLRQGLSNGMWNPYMWYLAPYSFSFRHVIPGLFVLGLLFTITLSLMWNLGWLFLFSILIPYFLLALFASIQQSNRYSWDLFPILPILFFAHHLAYGFGSLYGIVNLILRKAPILKKNEPWAGAGQPRAWPPMNNTSTDSL